MLERSSELFGARQARRYAQLFDRAFERITLDPFGLGTRGREPSGSGRRSLHLARVAARRSSARHVLFYRVIGDEVVVMAILHDAMDPALHVRDES